MNTTAFNAQQFMPPSDKRYYGPGGVCQTLQIQLGDLRELMAAAGVRFALLLDGVPYLDGEGFQAVSDAYQERKSHTDAMFNAAPHN